VARSGANFIIIFRRPENFKAGFIQKDVFSTELWFLLLFMAVPRKFTFRSKDVIHLMFIGPCIIAIVEE
jgi:hypothetical protein